MKGMIKKLLTAEIQCTTLTSNDARAIFIEFLPHLDEPLKSAVEFTLNHWQKFDFESRSVNVAVNFFARLPFLPTNDVDETFAAKLNEMAKLLRDAPDIWLSLENLPHEEWRDVVGYEGLYQVSNFGRVKSFQHKYPRIMRADQQSKGYMQVHLHKNGSSKNFGVHTLVAKAFCPNPENKLEVDHRNGDKTNNCVWNLGWATRKENTDRAYSLGLIKVKRGTQCHYAKLKAEDVFYIRENPDNLTEKELAEKFNVSRETIKRVRAGVTYKDFV